MATGNTTRKMLDGLPGAFPVPKSEAEMIEQRDRIRKEDPEAAEIYAEDRRHLVRDFRRD